MPIPRRRRRNIQEELDAISAEFPEPTSQECSVCYGTNPNYHRTTNCGHTLCRLCYKKIHDKICPICRTELNPELYVYKPPIFTPSSRYNKIKDRLELFLRRRQFYQDCKHTRLRKYVTLMATNANLFYFRGKYYPIYYVDAYWSYYYEHSVQDVVALYTYMLIAAANKVPIEIRKQIIENVRAAIQFY